jgi:hypothetical protein
MIAGLVLSNLFYVVGAIVAATVVSAFVLLRHRRPRSLESGIEMFSRELRALRPDRPPSQGGPGGPGTQWDQGGPDDQAGQGGSGPGGPGGQNAGRGVGRAPGRGAGNGASGERADDRGAGVDQLGPESGTGDSNEEFRRSGVGRVSRQGGAGGVGAVTPVVRRLPGRSAAPNQAAHGRDGVGAPSPDEGSEPG